jgi:hypothetical protein
VLSLASFVRCRAVVRAENSLLSYESKSQLFVPLLSDVRAENYKFLAILCVNVARKTTFFIGENYLCGKFG